MTAPTPIYLDHHAAAPPCPEAIAEMEEAKGFAWANPASPHSAGRRSRACLERAREQVAQAIGARPSEVVLTAGGTEACNTGVLGLGQGANMLLTTEIEHPAVLAPAGRWQKQRGPSAELRAIPVQQGRVPALEPFLQGVDADTVAVLQWVNHDTGTVLPIHAWCKALRARGCKIFVDATQALGKVEVDVRQLGADAVAFASHKMGGPSGAGALWVRDTAALPAFVLGGQQERGRRAGTPDVVAYAGFGAACARVGKRLEAMGHVARIRDRFQATLETFGAVVNGIEGPRVATVVNASVPGWKSAALVAALDLEGVCVSSGPACSSGLMSNRSEVVQRMYPHSPWRAESTLRISVGPELAGAEVERADEVLRRVLMRKRKPENVARAAPEALHRESRFSPHPPPQSNFGT